MLNTSRFKAECSWKLWVTVTEVCCQEGTPTAPKSKGVWPYDLGSALDLKQMVQSWFGPNMYLRLEVPEDLNHRAELGSGYQGGCDLGTLT